MQIDFASMKAESARFQEKGDCAVTAIALACEIAYVTSHGLLKRHGRRDKRGTFRTTTRLAVNEILGTDDFPIVKDPKQPRTNHGYTAKTIARLFPTGRHLVFVRGHVFALIEGKVDDWTDGRKHRVKEVWTVEIGKPLPEKEIRKRVAKQKVINFPKTGTTSARVWRLANANSGMTRQQILGLCEDEGINLKSASTMYANWQNYLKQPLRKILGE